MSASFFENAQDTNASNATFSAVGKDQHNHGGQRYISGNSNNFRGNVNNGDQYRGPVRAGVVGGSGHQNTFSPSNASDEDELLTVNINLTRVKHENKQLANALANTKAELASVRAELNRLKR